MKTIKQIEWTPERVARFWDYLSQFPEHYFTYQFGDILVDRMSKYLNSKHTVLDYGCGVGYLIPHLLKRNMKVTGLEFSQKSVDIVRNEFSSSEKFGGVFLPDELVRSGKTFDVVFVVEVIEHLHDNILDEILANIKKFLAPKGIVIFTTPLNEDLTLSMISCPECASRFHRWQHVRSWTVMNLSTYLEQHGFKILHCGATDFSVSLRKNWKNFLKYAGKRVLGTPPPHLFCVATI